MPEVVEVIRGKLKKHYLPDDLYKDFLDECLGISVDETPDIGEYLDTLSPRARKTLNDYIIHRLAEVDPGYVNDRTQ